MIHHGRRQGLGPAYLAGFRVVELPIVFRNRRYGKSKMSPRIAGEAIWLIPQLRQKRRHEAPG